MLKNERSVCTRRNSSSVLGSVNLRSVNQYSWIKGPALSQKSLDSPVSWVVSGMASWGLLNTSDASVESGHDGGVGGVGGLSGGDMGGGVTGAQTPLLSSPKISTPNFPQKFSFPCGARNMSGSTFSGDAAGAWSSGVRD
ncbi:hypothetical protein CTI12_AA296830 [Artemisia annua]|uniref:Uncharacterized protein n=1 Tax=Artemisia annua TaxID=35608 RepID=A0A2U1N7R0_ARTAN|nr:hypothetical protein CTI12_AA296830 [Artemisia annua]